MQGKERSNGGFAFTSSLPFLCCSHGCLVKAGKLITKKISKFQGIDTLL